MKQQKQKGKCFCESCFSSPTINCCLVCTASDLNASATFSAQHQNGKPHVRNIQKWLKVALGREGEGGEDKVLLLSQQLSCALALISFHACRKRLSQVYW